MFNVAKQMNIIKILFIVPRVTFGKGQKCISFVFALNAEASSLKSSGSVAANLVCQFSGSEM